MKSVKNSCSQLMTDAVTLFYLVGFMFITSSSVAFGQSVEAIEDELRSTEAALTEVDASRGDLSSLTKDIKGGKIILLSLEGGVPVPVDVDRYSQQLVLLFLSGDMSRERLKRQIAAISALRKTSVEAINELNEKFEANTTRLRDRRSYLLNERARLSESTYPNLAGAWEIAYQGTWRPTSVAQSGETLSFTNEFGDTSPGHFISKTRVKATKWEGGLGATVSGDGKTINWDNRTTWRRRQ